MVIRVIGPVLKFLVLILALGMAVYGLAGADRLDPRAVSSFIEEMVKRHGFDHMDLQSLFAKVELSPKVLTAISRPAEVKPWYEYKLIFVTPERAKAGIVFWRDNRHTLARVEERYGVASEVIVAIIGVETYYGRHTGNYRVMDALATLAFHYPARAQFFRSELEQLLLFAREQRIDPLSLYGSYAGAMGLPQFISSNYRRYAVDFDGDGYADIWHNHGDAIASVANYLKLHGWERGQPVVVRAQAMGEDYAAWLEGGLAPRTRLEDLKRSGIIPESKIEGNPLVRLIALQTEAGNEYWVGLKNFYVITRYNHSSLYAMAVYQLAQAIREGYQNRYKGDAGGLAGL